MGQQQEHFCEQLRLQEDIEDALSRAAKGKATEQDIKLLAWASGVQRKQEKRHEPIQSD